MATLKVLYICANPETRSLPVPKCRPHVEVAAASLAARRGITLSATFPYDEYFIGDEFSRTRTTRATAAYYASAPQTYHYTFPSSMRERATAAPLREVVKVDHFDIIVSELCPFFIITPHFVQTIDEMLANDGYLLLSPSMLVRAYEAYGFDMSAALGLEYIKSITAMDEYEDEFVLIMYTRKARVQPARAASARAVVDDDDRPRYRSTRPSFARKPDYVRVRR
jgi:hypothetical protein